MRVPHLSLLSAIVAIAPSLAYAQAPADPAADGEGSQPKKRAPAAASPVDGSAVRHGLFAESDLGVFLTFGGRNTNAPPDFPSRPTSNIQPYLGLTFGYAARLSDTLSLGGGLKIAAGYSAGAGRITGGDLNTLQVDDLATRPNDFAVMQAGAMGVIGIFLTDRVALTGKIDVGLGVADPNPTKSAAESGAAGAGIGVIAGAGFGVEYYTLLNDFSVGLDVRFGAILIGGFIPSVSATLPIKYTF